MLLSGRRPNGSREDGTMIKSMRLKAMDLTKRIVNEAWEGKTELLTEYAGESFGLIGLGYDTLQQDMDAIKDMIAGNRDRYPFRLLSQQYECRYSEAQLCVITGTFRLLREKETEIFEARQCMTAVWAQKGANLYLIHIHISYVTQDADVRVSEDQTKRKESVAVCDSDGIMYTLELSDILYVQSDRNYVDIITFSGSKKIHVRSTLHHFLKQLDDDRFVLFARNRILNLENLEKVSDDTVIMKNGDEFSISIKSRTVIRKLLRDYYNSQKM